MRVPAWLIAIASVLPLVAPAPSLAGDVTKAPPHDRFLLIPLRVHVLTSKDLDMTDGKITDAEVTRSVRGINTIWSKAGVFFGLESIVREPPAQVERFKAMLELIDGQVPELGPCAYLLPASSRATDGLHVYIFRDLPFNFNGGYLPGADATLVKENPELNVVKGGGADPLARVAARGLGMALGLKGRADEFGLLSSGTNGIGLGEAEVGRARQIARTIPGALEVDDALKAADLASNNRDLPRARQLWTWLAEVPATGPGVAEARKKLLALPSTNP